jgi:molecular chaperone GrpE
MKKRDEKHEEMKDRPQGTQSEHQQIESSETQTEPETTTKEEKPTEGDPVDALKAKIAELEQSVASYKDQLLRRAAEFENYKKRIENDISALTKFSNEELIVQLLPILDDLGRSLKAAKEQPNSESFHKGVELIYNKFLKALEVQGVKEVESVGKPFDVYYHDALMEIPKEDVPHHTVIDEVEKGYTLHGKVIRHARVILSSQAVEQPTGGSENNNAKESGSGSDRQ